MHRLIRVLTRALAGSTVLTSLLVGLGGGAHAASTKLTLINGWTSAPFGTGVATVESTGNIVRFKGAIASGTVGLPFVLPPAYRPAANVYVPVDMCGATNGHLLIEPSGQVELEAEHDFANAQCFTSLDGVWFARNANGFSALTPVNGWTLTPYGTSSPAVRNVSGVVVFKGAVYNGTDAQLFTLPPRFRPATDVYVTIDLCNSLNGRLLISSSGTVSVEAHNLAFAFAQCLTSLDGASYVLDESGTTPLTLIHQWTNAPFGTSNAAIENLGGVVHFTGAIANAKTTNPVPFRLPPAFRPTKNVFVKVDLCDTNNGRLFIRPDGTVQVQAETNFDNAKCFTSLDGVSFVQ